MSQHVCCEAFPMWAGEVTLVAAEGFFTTVGSLVYFNIISLRTSVVALIAFETLFTTMRKNVSWVCQLGNFCSCTGCTWMTSLHCVLTCDFWGFLSERRWSHTGRSWMVLPEYEQAHVFSDWLLWWKIGCTSCRDMFSLISSVEWISRQKTSQTFVLEWFIIHDCNQIGHCISKG